MISGQFSTCPISQISVSRETRQRKQVDDLSPLIDSISRLGLIHPLVLTRDFSLIAGERRLSACRALGWTDVPFQYVDEIDPLILHCIELEENIKRKDLTWQEQNDAIAKYHKLRAEGDKNWTEGKTAEALGLARQSVNSHLMVNRERTFGRVAESDTFRNAIRVAQGIVERRAADEGDVHVQTIGPCTSISNADFNEWAPLYEGPKFNFLHCDFPYGIKSDESGQGAAKSLGGYSDTEEVYWQLLKTLSVHLDNFCAPSAHIIFWFAPKFYTPTWELLKLLDDFVFDETPLIWIKDDQKGIAPDPSRRPRRVYEMAFFGWRGDRKILRLKNNAFFAPTTREIHPHEKSELALRHFFEMVVDKTTRLLDPTCGSGSALRAADALGAVQVLGLERDAEFAALAQRAFDRYRRTQRPGLSDSMGADEADSDADAT